MSIVWFYALGSVALISCISLVGAFTLSRDERWLENRVGDLVSMAAGVLLGSAVVHLLPEAFERLGNGLRLPLYFLAGFVGFFFLERYLWAHHHGLEGEPPHPLGGHHHGGHHETHTHAAAVGTGVGTGDAGDTPVHPLVTLNLIGDGIHNFIDGMLIAAAFLIDPGLGVVTAVAIMLHELPQEIGDFAVLVHGGLSPKRALFFNFLSASMALGGAFLALMIGTRVEGFVEVLIPVAAGNFLYVAAADLIPELHRSHSKGGVRHIIIFLLGLGIMIALRVLWRTFGVEV